MDEPTPDQRHRLQFSLKSIFVFMTGLGFACVLAPRESLPLQFYCVVYLLIGFGQTCYALASWRPSHRKTASRRCTPSTTSEAFVSIQVGYWLTLPAWLLMVVLLVDHRWHHLPVSLEDLVRMWAILAVVTQLAGVLINFGNLLYFTGLSDIVLGRLALLNLAHGVILVGGCFASLLFIPDLWRRY